MCMLSEIDDLQKNLAGVSVLEALAATGLRAIRYAKEVSGIGQIIANDMDADAVNAQRRNIEFNAVEDKVTPNLADARLVMLQHSQVRVELCNMRTRGVFFEASAVPLQNAESQTAHDRLAL
jgi:tRNA G26 N,N-dimethylase Trm1